MLDPYGASVQNQIAQFAAEEDLTIAGWYDYQRSPTGDWGTWSQGFDETAGFDRNSNDVGYRMNIWSRDSEEGDAS